jgi:hypothetical protein
LFACFVLSLWSYEAKDTMVGECLNQTERIE